MIIMQFQVRGKPRSRWSRSPAAPQSGLTVMQGRTDPTGKRAPVRFSQNMDAAVPRPRTLAPQGNVRTRYCQFKTNMNEGYAFILAFFIKVSLIDKNFLTK